MQLWEKKRFLNILSTYIMFWIGERIGQVLQLGTIVWGSDGFEADGFSGACVDVPLLRQLSSRCSERAPLCSSSDYSEGAAWERARTLSSHTEDGRWHSPKISILARPPRLKTSSSVLLSLPEAPLLMLPRSPSHLPEILCGFASYLHSRWIFIQEVLLYSSCPLE